jgi:hypothetical protein
MVTSKINYELKKLGLFVKFPFIFLNHVKMLSAEIIFLIADIYSAAHLTVPWSLSGGSTTPLPLLYSDTLVYS